MRGKDKWARMMAHLIIETAPERWPTLDEQPQSSTDDLVQAALYQSTIDAQFEEE